MGKAIDTSFATLVRFGRADGYSVSNTGRIGPDGYVTACSSVDGGPDFDSTAGRLERTYAPRSSLVDIGSRGPGRPSGWGIREFWGRDPIYAWGETRREALDDFCSRVARRVIDGRNRSLLKGGAA